MSENAKTKVRVASLRQVGEDFVNAWKAATRDEHVEEVRTLTFESWEGLASLLSGERYRLLQHLRQHPEPSVSALARALGRPYPRVHSDVSTLEGAGLVDRSEGNVRAAADRLSAEVYL